MQRVYAQCPGRQLCPRPGGGLSASCRDGEFHVRRTRVVRPVRRRRVSRVATPPGGVGALGQIHVRDAACPSMVARAMWGMLRWRGGGGQSRSPMRLAAAVSCRGRDRSCRGLPQRRYTRGGCSYVVAASSACRLVPCCRRPERSAAVSAALVIGMTRTSPLPWPPPRAHVRRPCHRTGQAVTRIGHSRYGTSSGCRAAVPIGTTRTLSPRSSPRGVPLSPCTARWRTPRVLRSEDNRNDPYIIIAAAAPAGACCWLLYHY